jgi:hypothetical protein
MEINHEFEEGILKKMVDEYLTKSSLIPSASSGLFLTLNLIADAAELWDLKIILIIAENGELSIDNIVQNFGNGLSRSSIYRKIHFLLEKKILTKNQNGLIYLAAKYNSLSILGQIHRSIKNQI